MTVFRAVLGAKNGHFHSFGAMIGKGFSFAMTPHLLIRGGRQLSGTIRIDGMKNAALPILFALLLVRDEVTLEELPPVTDIENTLQILCKMGADLTRLSPTAVRVNTKNADPDAVPLKLTTELRASAYLLGAGLGRFGRATTGVPGGCDFGARPLDQHFRLLESLGAVIEPEKNLLRASAPNGLRGANLRLDFPSVGATVNGILAAALAKGTTVISGAAREPHIADLADFLNACGARISGAGTSTIRIDGVSRLHGTDYRVLPDMIEAGTYLCAVCGTGGSVRLDGVCPAHLGSILLPLRKMGAEIAVSDDHLTLKRTGDLYGTVLETAPYPGFPTDMQPQFAPLLCLSRGGGRIYERVWKKRFQYIKELERMGATVMLGGDFADFSGGDRLTDACVRATDLRGGAALLIAGLCAEGVTELCDVHHIERGYPCFTEKLTAIGADVSFAPG